MVVSNDEIAAKLQDEIPKTIDEFACVEYFRYADSLPKVLRCNARFLDSIKYLCSSDEPEPDKIECVASVLCAAWFQTNKKEIDVFALLIKARQMSPSFIRLLKPDEEEKDIDSEAKTILDNISGFSYWLSRGYFNWSFQNGLDKGTYIHSIETKEFQHFERRIINQKPDSFEEIENLL